jgi:hypothetical protein
MLQGMLLMPAHSAAQRAPARGGPSAFAIEAAGGALGSAAGFGLGVLVTNPENCPSEDLRCTLEKVGAALAISAGGSALGTMLVGNAANTRPSALGAFVGGALGIVAGVAAVHVISEEMDLSRENVVLWVGYTVTQGLVTALGSRVVRALRD